MLLHSPTRNYALVILIFTTVYTMMVSTLVCFTTRTIQHNG